MDDAPSRAETIPTDPPPFLATWRNVYTLLVVELVVTVLAFYALARWAT